MSSGALATGGDCSAASEQFERSSAHTIASAESLLVAVRRQLEGREEVEKQLRAEVAALQARLDGGEGAPASTGRAKAPTANSKHKLRAEVNALRVENAMLKADIGDAAAVRNNLAKVTQEKQALLGEVFSIKVLNGNLKAANDSMRAELAVTKGVVAQLRSSKEAIAKEMAAVVQDQRAQIATLKASNKELAIALASTRAEMEAATITSTQLAEANEALETKLTAYKTDYEELEKELAAANEALATLTRSSSNMTAVNADLRGQVADLKATVERLTAEQSTVQGELAAAKAEMSSLQVQNEAVCTELSALTTRKRQTEAEMAAIIQELASIKSENTQLSEQKAERERRLRAMDRVQRNLDTKNLVAFFEQTFDCTGRTEVLHAALEKLHGRVLSQDDADLTNKPAAGSRFAPKPLLLIHQIDLPQNALGSAALAARPDPGAIEGLGRTQVADVSAVAHPASAPVLSEEADSSCADAVMNEGGGEQERTSASANGNDEHKQPENVDKEQLSEQEEEEVEGKLTPPSTRKDADSAIVEEVKGQEQESADSSEQDGDDNDNEDEDEDEEDESEQSPLVMRGKTARSTNRLRSSQAIPDMRRSPRNVFETPPAKRRRASLGVETGSSAAQKTSRSPRSTPSNHERRGKKAEASGDRDAVSISATDIQQLYDSEPWEAAHKRRPRYSRTFRYQSLSKDAQAWVDKALVFRDVYRMQLWERQHWVYVPVENRPATMTRFVLERRKRSIPPNCAWRKLRSKAEELISSGDLTSAVWSEPFLWCWRDDPFSWEPKSRNLAEDLARVDEQQPERCFHVDALFNHPFYASGLSKQHKAKFQLPSA